MLQALPQDSVPAALTQAAFRDTIAAIVRNAAYSRTLTESYWDRALRWVGDRLEELFGFLRTSDFARYLTIALLIAVGVLIVARLVIGVRDDERVRTGGSRERTSGTASASLAEAERLAALGDFTAAAHALFAALLATSAARGEVRLHPSKTTGDYARELRRRNVKWIRSFQLFRSRYDRVIYGEMLCSPGDYELLAREARVALAGDGAA